MNFRTLHREKVYTGRAFSVERVEMQLPNGKSHTYDLVHHQGAVTIVPLDSQGNLLFVRQYRIGAEQDLLELPAGVLNGAEDPADAAAREVREETGMGAQNLLLLGSCYLAPGYSSEFMYFYLATGLYPSPLQQDEDEFLKLEAIPAAEALQMARSGGIRDGKTLAALFLAESHLL